MSDVKIFEAKDEYVKRHGKSYFIAYLLFMFFGSLGLHRFYVGKHLSGLCLLILTVLSYQQPWAFMVIFCWWIFDMFATYYIVKEYNDDVGTNYLLLESMWKLKDLEERQK